MTRDYAVMRWPWFASVLVLLPHIAAPHPQCLDFQPPFESSEVDYCREYRDFGCCLRDRKLSRRVDRLLKLRLEEAQQELCEPYLRNVSCLQCNPYSAHIYEAEGGSEPREFPLLCRSYCEEAFQVCNPLLMRYFRLRADEYGIRNFPKSDEELVNNSKIFCAHHVPQEDTAYCYPNVLAGPQIPTTGDGSQPQEEGELGCICALPVASGLRNPIAAVHAGDGSGRLFIAEQRGTIRVLLPNNTLLPDPFLDISGSILTSSRAGDERGLLGLAFHPNYRENGRFFVYYSKAVSRSFRPRSNHVGQVSEFRVQEDNPNSALAGSERVILTVPQPYGNHNGGQLLFKDGYLLVFLGDGGSAGDPAGHGQDRSTLLGSVLRIDVDNEDQGLEYAIPADNPFIGVAGVRPEVYAYGLRNPWRCSVDRGERRTGEGKGRIFCGDVGQSKYEEVDIIERGGNYGWKAFEGYSCYDRNLCSSQALVNATAPIDAYSHQGVGVSITGGYVYRGCLFPNLRGLYIFGDYGSGKVFALREEPTSGEWQRKELCMGGEDTCTGNLVGVDRARYITSFGEDEDGEVYILATDRASPTNPGGLVYQIVDPARREFPRKCRNVRKIPTAD